MTAADWHDNPRGFAHWAGVPRTGWLGWRRPAACLEYEHAVAAASAAFRAIMTPADAAFAAAAEAAKAAGPKALIAQPAMNAHQAAWTRAKAASDAILIPARARWDAARARPIAPPAERRAAA